jgi:hypothetical protein
MKTELLYQFGKTEPEPTWFHLRTVNDITVLAITTLHIGFVQLQNYQAKVSFNQTFTVGQTRYSHI